MADSHGARKRFLWTFHDTIGYWGLSLIDIDYYYVYHTFNQYSPAWSDILEYIGFISSQTWHQHPPPKFLAISKTCIQFNEWNKTYFSLTLLAPGGWIPNPW